MASPVLAASTRDVDADERFDYFCDSLCDVYLGVRPQRTSDAPFLADVLAFDMGERSALSRIRAPGHDARRDNRSIAATSDDAFFLNVVADSTARLVHLDDQHMIRAGQPVLIDNQRPFDLALTASRRFTLYTLRIPRASLGAPISASDVGMLNRRLASTEGSIVAAQTRLMHREFEAGHIEAAAAMATAVRVLLRSLSTRSDRPDRAAIDETPGYAAVTATAAQHLDDPDFDLRGIARAVGRSPRSVQALFAANDQTWSTWVLAARLDNARERIESASWSQRSLARIAAASGFRDASHFHRAFRARFGDAPGGFRPAARGR